MPAMSQLQSYLWNIMESETLLYKTIYPLDPSGKHGKRLHNYGTSPFFMGKSTINHKLHFFLHDHTALWFSWSRPPADCWAVVHLWHVLESAPWGRATCQLIDR